MAFAELGDTERAWELFSLLNPIRHADDTRGGRPSTRSSRTSSPPTSTRVAPHTGRGGWTWYTGSAGWMYRLIVETLLGLRLEVDRLLREPAAAARLGVRSSSTTATARRSTTSP